MDTGRPSLQQEFKKTKHEADHSPFFIMILRICYALLLLCGVVLNQIPPPLQKTLPIALIWVTYLLCGLSLQANYTDRGTAACRRS
jgi:uncharacterized protein with PQ loop repeat